MKLFESSGNAHTFASIMGPVIGSHVGPGAVAVIWKTAELRND